VPYETELADEDRRAPQRAQPQRHEAARSRDRLRHRTEGERTPTARTRDRRALDKLPEDEQLLVRAAHLVARGWCQRAPAEDWRGRPVDPRSGSACRWSPLGALTRVWSESPGAAPDAFRAAWIALAL